MSKHIPESKHSSDHRWQLGCLRIGFADVLFVFLVLTIMQHATQGMVDDPGLGWHLRIPDLMVEQGGFVYEEHFSFPTEGNRWVTRAWLSDFLLRIAYGWGGLNAVALLTCCVVAGTMRMIYQRLAGNGFHWLVAAVATFFAVISVAPTYVARPNIFSLLGVWLVADTCQRFHAGKITHKRLFWLVPVLLLWANMHGGFMAGLVLIAIAGMVELGLGLGAWKRATRVAAWQRLRWFVGAGLVCGLATLCNPNGIGLHLYNLQAVVDPFIQNNTTTEWLPPDFRSEGWFRIELLILLLPLLAATCRRRVNWMGLVMTVAWLHFALTCRRYSTLWVIIAIPTLCELAVYNPWMRRLQRWFRTVVSDDVQELMQVRATPTPSTAAVSWLFAMTFLVGSAFIPSIAAHNPQHMPADSLDRFLKLHDGGATFHSVNWGGYLTWKGWDRPERFRTWIDDRIEVHGEAHTREYFAIIYAEEGWEEKLAQRDVKYVCVPPRIRLAMEMTNHPDWQERFADDYVAVFEKAPRSALQVSRR